MIVGIEGINSAGKTSLIQQLIADPQYGGVAEVSAMVPEGIPFPGSASEAQANEQLIAGIEYERIRIAHAVKQLGKSCVILDRSVISTIVISLAHSRLRGWHKNSLHFLRRCMDEAFTVNLLPDVIVHLEIDAKLLGPRQLSRTNKLSDQWTDKEFIATQQSYYKTIYSFLQTHGLCKIIYADAAKSQQDVYADVTRNLSAITCGEQRKHHTDLFKWLINDVA